MKMSGSGTVVHGEFAMDPLVQTRKGIDRIAASQIEEAIGHVLSDARGRSGDIGDRAASAEITGYLTSKGLAA